MKDYKIEFEYKETLLDALLDTVEYVYSFDGLEGFCPIGSDELFKTDLAAAEYALKIDEDFSKCRSLSMIDFIVPVYDKDDFLIHYLPYSEAMLLKSDT